VRLAQRTADDLRDLGRERFDTIILNSVAQYFPGIDYLFRVIRGAVGLATADGKIFLGDIRCLPLLRVLHTDTQLCNAPDELTIKDVQVTIEKQLTLEKELLIDPAFFRALQQVLPGIARVEIQLKRGCFENELTKFRYDVVLHLGKAAVTRPDASSLQWGKDVSTLDDLRRLLSNSRPEQLTVKAMPNARLSAPLRRMERLAHQPSTMTVGEFRKIDGDMGATGVDPEDLWAL